LDTDLVNAGVLILDSASTNSTQQRQKSLYVATLDVRAKGLQAYGYRIDAMQEHEAK